MERRKERRSGRRRRDERCARDDAEWEFNNDNGGYKSYQSDMISRILALLYH